MLAPRRARAIDALSLLLLAAIALLVVARFGDRYPNSDDWDLVVPALDGEQTISPHWLWAQHNEHRLPLPKLTLIAADTLTHGDFRGGAVASWLMLVALALTASWSIRRLAGRAPWWAILLVAGIALNPSNNAFRWGVEVQFVVSALLMMLAVCATMTAPADGPPCAWRVAVAGVSSLFLPMSGGNGVLFSLTAIAATIFLGVRATSTAARAIAASCVALTVALLAGYFVGYRSPPNHEAIAATSLSQTVFVGAHVLVAPFGPVASRFVVVAAPAALVVLVLVGAILRRAHREERLSAPVFAGVLMTAAGSALVLGAVAIGRGARGWDGFETHYASLLIPLWLTVCAALLSVGAFRIPAAICVVATAALLVSLPIGPPPPHVALGSSFRRDWCARTPADELARRYIGLFYYVDTPEAQATVAAKLAHLRVARPDLWRCASP